MLVLPFTNGSFNLWSEAIEMDITTGISIGVSDQDSSSIAIFLNDSARNIAISNRIDAKIYLPFSFDVDTPMKVVRTRLAKVACQLHWNVNWRTER